MLSEFCLKPRMELNVIYRGRNMYITHAKEYDNRIWTLKKETYTINFTVNKCVGTMHEKCCYFSPDQIAHIQRPFFLFWQKYVQGYIPPCCLVQWGLIDLSPAALHLSKDCWQIKINKIASSIFLRQRHTDRQTDREKNRETQRVG